MDRHGSAKNPRIFAGVFCKLLRALSLTPRNLTDVTHRQRRKNSQDLASQGKDVLLREATGVGRTSDLVVNGVEYDVYTPEAGTSVRNILSNTASKWTQVNGGGVVVDLGNTELRASDFGDNALARVNGFVNSYGGTPLSDVTFYRG
jgi:hypothetical protein